MTKILFIGGTGLISSECATLALQNNFEVYLLTRGQRALDLPPNTPAPKLITADISAPASAQGALAGHTFDCVINFIAYQPADVERDIRLFAGRTAQYILISSASCYDKPPTNYLITESTPLSNPFWEYARDKIGCEETITRALHDKKFPATIVRPSLTYGNSRIPASYHNSAYSWTTAHRLLAGKPVIVHGDGTGLWQVTHAADFAQGLLGLLANPRAVGEAFHITTHEVLTWNAIATTLAATLGVAPNLIHIPTDFIAHHDPARGPGLVGDKQFSVVLDNSKIKSFVPAFSPTIPLATGLARTIAWFRADPKRQQVDPAMDALTDKIIAAYQRGLEYKL